MPENVEWRGEWDTAEDFISDLLVPNELDVSDIIGVGLEHENDNWTIIIHTDDWDFTTSLNTDDLPEWVWDDLYYLADIYEWDWDVSYDGD